MSTKPEVPPLSAEQAAMLSAYLITKGGEETDGDIKSLQAIASGQHIVIRNPAGLIEKWKAFASSFPPNHVVGAVYVQNIRDLTALIAGAGDE